MLVGANFRRGLPAGGVSGHSHPHEFPLHDPQWEWNGPLSPSLSPSKGERVPKAGEGWFAGSKREWRREILAPLVPRGAREEVTVGGGGGVQMRPPVGARRPCASGCAPMGGLRQDCWRSWRHRSAAFRRQNGGKSVGGGGRARFQRNPALLQPEGCAPTVFLCEVFA